MLGLESIYDRINLIESLRQLHNSIYSENYVRVHEIVPIVVSCRVGGGLVVGDGVREKEGNDDGRKC